MVTTTSSLIHAATATANPTAPFHPAGSFDPHACTLETCSINYANFTYIPNLAGNVLYAVLLGVILLAHLFFGLRFKTWGFLIGMFFGLLAEIIGYAGRIQLHFNPFPFNPFVEQLICLTIGPAFLSASIYLCLARIITAYGPSISRVKPRVYSYIFMPCDFISLVLQGAGGGIAATAKQDQTKLWRGIHIMIAGLIFQVVTLALFIVMCAEYGLRVRRNRVMKDGKFADLRRTFKFKALLYALAAATILIFIRCLYRVAELQGGFKSHLANDQVTFMIFEGPMIILATLVLAVFHPGICFGGRWQEAKPATGKSANASAANDYADYRGDKTYPESNVMQVKGGNSSGDA